MHKLNMVNYINHIVFPYFLYSLNCLLCSIQGIDREISSLEKFEATAPCFGIGKGFQRACRGPSSVYQQCKGHLIHATTEQALFSYSNRYFLDFSASQADRNYCYTRYRSYERERAIVHKSLHLMHVKEWDSLSLI